MAAEFLVSLPPAIPHLRNLTTFQQFADIILAGYRFKKINLWFIVKVLQHSFGAD